MSDRKIALYLFIFLLSVYLLTASLRIDSGDGETMYRVTYSMITGQGFAIPVEPRTEDTFGPWGIREPVEMFKGGDGYGLWGRDGRYYAKYGLGWSLAAAPFCALGRIIALNLPGVTEGFATRAAVMLLNPLLTAGTSVLLFYLARRFNSKSLAVSIALLYGVFTIAWYYAKSAFSEPLVTLLLLGAILAIERKRFLLAGISLGGMILTRQTAVFLTIPVLLWAIFRVAKDGSGKVPQRLVKIGLPIVLGQMLVWGYNFYRFGNILEYGYIGITWGTPIFLGLYSLLLSPGKGLFVFSPILILGVFGWVTWNRRRDWFFLLAGLFIFQIIPHALYVDWSGGGGWGPRLLLPIVPIILLPAGNILQRWQVKVSGQLALVVLLALSLFIQIMGVSVNWVRHLQRKFDQSDTPEEYFFRVHYNWTDAPIIGQIRSFQETLSLLINPKTLDHLV